MAKWKLVRDKIPACIERSGDTTPEHDTLKTWELPFFLDLKFAEEEAEYQDAVNGGNLAKIREELADLVEVVRARAEYHGITWVEVLGEQKKKCKERGGFSRGIILKL
jgi:predicted house-cleaning noncanonical NTP pyrophosphatase (MazG superfamily)